jgi:hypothetical protein
MKKVNIKILSFLILLVILILPEIVSANPLLSTELRETDSLKSGWGAILGLINIVTVVGLIFIAIATLLRIDIEQYNIKRLLPSLVVGVIAANFSFFFCMEILDISSSIHKFFEIENLGEVMAGIFASFGFKAVAGGVGLGGLLAAIGLTGGGIVTVVVGGLLAMLPILALAIFTAMLYVRWVIVWALIIVSPLAFVFYFLPFSKGVAGTWFSWFLKWVFLAPIANFFIWLLTWIHAGPGKDEGILLLIASIGLLVAAVYVPFMLGGVVFGNILGWGQKLIGAGKWAGNTTEGKRLHGKAYEAGRKVPGIKQMLNMREQSEAEAATAEEYRKKRVEKNAEDIVNNQIKLDAQRMWHGNAGAQKKAEDNGNAVAKLAKDLVNSDASNARELQSVEDLRNQLLSDAEKATASPENLHNHKVALSALQNLEADPGRYGKKSDEAAKVLSELNVLNPNEKREAQKNPDQYTVPRYPLSSTVKASVTNLDELAQQMKTSVEDKSLNTLRQDLTKIENIEGDINSNGYDINDHSARIERITGIPVGSQAEGMETLRKYRQTAQAAERILTRTGGTDLVTLASSGTQTTEALLKGELRVIEKASLGGRNVGKTAASKGITNISTALSNPQNDDQREVRERAMNEVSNIVKAYNQTYGGGLTSQPFNGETDLSVIMSDPTTRESFINTLLTNIANNPNISTPSDLSSVMKDEFYNLVQ